MKLITDEKIEHLYAAYQKLMPFLAKVPAMHHDGNTIPSDPHGPFVEGDEYCPGYRNNRFLRVNPEDEIYPYRSDYPYRGNFVIVWEPKVGEYPRPTWQEFFQVYAK